MAKKSMIARDDKREVLLKRFKALRTTLKAQANNKQTAFEERQKARVKLQQLPRDTSAVRWQRRCYQCGRPRAVYRKFALCRICLRGALMSGQVPGGRKASW